MKRWVKIQSEPIDEPALLQSRKISRGIGAVVHFLGTVRDQENADQITALEYEAFSEMAMHQFHKIFDEVERRWPVESIRLVHRIGMIAVSTPSLWVEITAPHRAEAFAACQYLIDEMKQLVPIWKKPVR